MILAFTLTSGVARADVASGLREAVQRGDSAEIQRLLKGVPKDGSDEAAAALIWSAYYGKVDLLKDLLQSGVPATAADPRGWTALMAAVKGNQPEAVDFLLAHGADANARPKEGGSSAMALATELGRTTIIERFRQHSGNTPVASITKDTFAAAVRDHRLEAIKACLADPTFRTSGGTAQGALLLAIEGKDAVTATALLDRGADANEPAGDPGVTPLVAAAKADNADAARALLEHGADPDRPPTPGAPDPLTAAIAARSEEVARLLAQQAVQSHHPLKSASPLFYAIGVRLPSLVAPLAAAGADVNAVNGDGFTTLMWAVGHCHEAVDPLLALHARLDLRDHDGRSVLEQPEGAWLAAKLRQAGAGAQVDAVLSAPHPNRAQLSEALLAAVKRGDAAAVKNLLDQGASPQTCNKLQWPVCVLAASLGHTEIVRLFDERDPFTLLQSAPGGWTPLQEAAGNGHLETVRYLLARHLDPQIGNVFRHRPLDYAQQRGYPEVAQLLQEALRRAGPVPGRPFPPGATDP